MSGRTVLVTGVSRHLGGKVASALAEHAGVRRVLGVDMVPPALPLGDVAFVRADIRNPAVGRLMVHEGVDTVVHMNVLSSVGEAGGRVAMKETNVIGTMQLLAASQTVPTLRRLVVRSTAGVYGAGPGDPALFAEDSQASRPPRTGWAKDCLELEGYVRGFTRRRPDVPVALVRLADLLGVGQDSGIARLFRLPAIPTLLGHDGRLQFLHVDDAVAALVAAAVGTVEGPVNVAGAGVVTTSQVAALVGRPLLGLPEVVAGPAARWLRRLGAGPVSVEELRLLGYGRVLDTTKMRRELHFEPAMTTREVVRDFVRHTGLRGVRPAVDLVLEEIARAVDDSRRVDR